MSAEFAPIVPITPAVKAKSDEILQRLIGRRTTLKADAEFIAGEIASIDSQLLELLGAEVGTHDVGESKVQIKEYSRLDTAWIETEYPADRYPQLYKTATSVDAAAVKKEFAPTVLAEHQVRGAKSVVVK